MCFCCLKAPGRWCDALVSWTNRAIPRISTRLFKGRMMRSILPWIETWFCENHWQHSIWRFLLEFWRDCHQKIRNLSRSMCFYCVEAPGRWCDALVSWTKGEIPGMSTRLFMRKKWCEALSPGIETWFWENHRKHSIWRFLLKFWRN